MSAFTRTIRSSFSGAAASVALAIGVAASAPAQAQFRSQVPQFPDSCVSFDGDQTRRQQRYDEALSMLVKNLKAYSGWEDIRKQMKATNTELEGLCPSMTVPSAVTDVPQAKAFAVNVKDPSTGQAIDPKKFKSMIEEGNYSITGPILTIISTYTMNPESNPLIADDHDLNTRVLLMTALQSNAAAEFILAGAEAGGKDERFGDLNFAYTIFPRLAAEISDIHAQAIAAKSQNRALNETEKTKFRQTLFTIMLKDPGMRANAAEGAVKQLAGTLIQNALEDKPVALPAFKAFSVQGVADKLQRFPGKLTEAPALKTYKSDWDARPSEDAVKAMEGKLPELPAMARDAARTMKEQQKAHEEMKRSLPPGFMIITPQ